LLFLDRDTLVAQGFDVDRLELKGQAVALEGHVARASIGNGAYSASSNGIVAYAGTLAGTTALTWFDRGGNPLGSIGAIGDYTDFRLSPDGARLAASLADPRTGYPDIWLMDLDRGNSAPFTFGPAVNASPVWSPDGARLIFRTTRKGGLTELYGKSSGGGGKEDLVLAEETQRAVGFRASTLNLCDWSPDGRHVLFSLGNDLWLLPLEPGARPSAFVTAPGSKAQGNFAPDGRLVAYTSNESGRFEIHVQTFPLSDRQWTVSNNGGSEPRWRSDGREMYFLSEDRKLMAVAVEPGPKFGTPRSLFQTRVPIGVSVLRTHYDVSRDGRHFLIASPVGDPPPTPITVVLNWTVGLKK
jgi:dipeptidyl aminopeptidase/acylaminoacyl peptidase